MLSVRVHRRRRPALCYRTDPPPPAAAGSPVLPPRQVIVRIRPRAQPVRVLVSSTPRTVLPTGGYSGARAPIVVTRSPRQVPRVRTMVLRPLAGSSPNTPPPPPPPGGSGGIRPQPLIGREWSYIYRPRVISMTAPIIATPFPRPLVGRVPRAPGAARPRVVQSPARGVTIVPAARVIVPRVVAPAHRPRRLGLAAATSSVQQIRHPRTVIVRVPTAPPGRTVASAPGRIATSTAAAAPRQYRAVRGLVVPVPRPPGRPVRWVILGPSSPRYPTLPLRPAVIRRPAGVSLPSRLIAPAPRYPLASPSRQDPGSLVRVFRRLYGPGSPEILSTAQYYRRIVVNPPPPINPLVPPGMPPDLVAAAIGWLRFNGSIVSAFGDGIGSEKFGADLASRGTSPPYLEFHEPEEDETFESLDQTGNPSSLAEGWLWAELVGPQSLGKLGTRQLAETVAASLTDAPLTFADGVLVYLRRTKRRFPTFREPGPGGNAATWKRILEFRYLIERPIV